MSGVDPLPEPAPSAPAPAVPPAGNLRQRVARGTLINGAFLVGVNGVALLRGFVVAAFLTASDYGFWGVLVILLSTVIWLKQAGISDRYMQQDETDQVTAFQRALTVELCLAVASMAAGVVIVPLIALGLGQTGLILPGLILMLALPAAALQAPIWVYTRNLDFARQRQLESVEPLVGFVVIIVLLILGAGYWSLLAGTLVGGWAAALVALKASPYPIKFTIDRKTLRDYAGFSWPLLVGGATNIIFAQALTFVGEAEGGFALLGALSLASTLTQFANRADQAVTEAVYPAICRVKDRADLLLETFQISNRLALLWGVPFGAAAALFSPDLVRYLLGENKWGHAVLLLQVLGATAAAHQIAFNWDAFYRAQGMTRQTAVIAVLNLVAFLAVPVPLLGVYGLNGVAAGFVIVEVINLAGRAFYVRKLFPTLPLVRFVSRATAPALASVGIVLLARLAEPSHRTPLIAVLEIALYTISFLALVAVFERALMAQVLGYLRKDRRPAFG